MPRLSSKRFRADNTWLVAVFASAIIVGCSGCGGAQLKPWHTEKLDEEFTEDKTGEVRTFDDYLALEDRLFRQLDEEIYAQSETGPEHKLDRYSPGSLADPSKYNPNWNRSFELVPDDAIGAVLLLHGMSDSPYSLLALGKALKTQGFRVVGLRMPGHGTAPSGLRHMGRDDMAAAVRIAMTHLDKKVNGKPVHIIGYSTGAALALEFALDAQEGKTGPVPGSLILISPAIAIHPSAALASFKDWMSNIPGLDGLAYTQIQPEFDPYKYNSFTANAADVVHVLTRSVARRIEQRAAASADVVLPPVLVFKSTVDATVSTDAVIDNLLEHLRPHRHELVLFDINRYAASYRILIDDPAPLTNRVLQATDLPFSVTLVTNESAQTRRMISKHIEPYTLDPTSTSALDLAWPPGVISLSHVALPFAPGDPLYGQRPPDNEDFLFLGQMAIQGERGLLKIPSDWMFRLRYNPFFDYLESRTLDWIHHANETAK